MNRIRKNNTIKIKVNPESVGAKALLKLLIFRDLRKKYRRGVITLAELKQQLEEHKISTDYDKLNTVSI